MGQPKTRHRKGKSATAAESASPPPPPPSPVAVIDHVPQTHTFAYSQSSAYAACAYGVEQDMTLRDGKATRLYRITGSEWLSTVAACPKYVAPVAPSSPPSSATGHNIVATFSKAVGALFEPEIIGGSDVGKAAEMVDLSVACSPVLRHARGGVRDVQVLELANLDASRLWNADEHDRIETALREQIAALEAQIAAFVRRTPTIQSGDTLADIEAKVELAGVPCPIEPAWMDTQVTRSSPADPDTELCRAGLDVASVGDEEGPRVLAGAPERAAPLYDRAIAAWRRLDAAKRSGDPVAIAAAKGFLSDLGCAVGAIEAERAREADDDPTAVFREGHVERAQ